MAVRVKPGRKYYIGGKEYYGGETVPGVPEKYLRVLTGPKGPLEYATVAMSPEPAHAVPEPVEAAVEASAGPEVIEPAPLDEEAPRRRRAYRRRDLTAEN